MALNDKYSREIDFETLHSQAKEWIEEVRFYIHELTFLNHLILEKIGSTTTEGQQHKDLFRNMDGMLQSLSKQTMIELNAHEAYLSNLWNTQDLEKNTTYQLQHALISKRLTSLKKGIRTLKSSFYDYAKTNPFTNPLNFENGDVV